MPLNHLRKLHPFLQKLSIQAVSTILQSGSIIVLEKDQVLYKENQEDLKFYLIIFGCLELLTRQTSTTRVDEQTKDSKISKSISTMRQLEPIDEFRLSMVREEDNKEEEQVVEHEVEGTNDPDDPYNGKYFQVVTTQSDEEEGQ